MASTHLTDLTAARAEDAKRDSMFDQVVSARTLNMVALTSSVLWLLGMLSSITQVAGSSDDPAAWDYVAAANGSSGFLVVTLVAWVGAAIIGSTRR